MKNPWMSARKIKPNKYPPGWTGKFSESAAKRRKYRKSDCSKCKINKKTDRPVLHSENINGKKDGEVCQCDRYRTKRQRNGKRSKDTCNCCHKSDHSELSCRICLIGSDRLIHKITPLL